MKYVLYIIQILSTVIAAVSICAFVYFSARTHMAHRSAFILLSLFLFALTAVISGLATIICESIRDDKSKQQIFAKIIRNINELKNSKASQPIDSRQLHTHRNNVNDEVHFQSLLNSIQSLDNKLDNYMQNAADQSVLLSSTLTDLNNSITSDLQNPDPQNLSQLANDVYSIKTHLEKLETKIKDMTTAARVADAFDSPKYAKPQEEASYPEFVMNLKSPEPIEASEYENVPLDPLKEEKIDLSSDIEDEKVDLSSDIEDEKVDLSLEDPVEEKVDLSLDPSNSTDPLTDTSDDVSSPADDLASDRLKDIFNDQFASEIADLDILNDEIPANEEETKPLTQDINLNDFLK